MAIKKLVKVWDGKNIIKNNIKFLKLKTKEIYPAKGEKKVSRVALLTGCVQKEISPQINESSFYYAENPF